MTINQMAHALQSVGACFAVTTAKTILPHDPFGSKPSYHIHPDASYPHEKNIERIYSQKQLMDWVHTMKAVQRIPDDEHHARNEQGFHLWQAYEARWEEAGL